MQYNNELRLEIGRQVVTHELTRQEAMQKYGIGKTCVDKYIHLYKVSAGIPTRTRTTTPIPKADSLDIEAYMDMSKEQLINLLIISKANELRAKKGYEVKGAGSKKEFIPLNKKNMK